MAFRTLSANRQHVAPIAATAVACTTLMTSKPTHIWSPFFSPWPSHIIPSSILSCCAALTAALCIKQCRKAVTCEDALPPQSAQLDDDTLQRALNVAVSAAEVAGNMMLECFGRNETGLGIETKTSGVDLVTYYDPLIEDEICKRLRKAFPDFGIVAEERRSGEVFTDKPTWIVDPIDGTTNFAHKQPECCVLIGLAIGKQTVLGVCYIPKMGELYTAVRGKGAYCNGFRINASGCKELRKAVISNHFPQFSRGTKNIERNLNVTRDLLRHPIQGMRSGGSAGVDMIHVARGRLDAYYEVGTYAWDVSAGAIIVQEAGGVCLDTLGGAFDLESRRMLVAATPELAAELVHYLRKHRYASLDAEDYVVPPELDRK